MKKRIILISGMDFSGKSTTVDEIERLSPGDVTTQSKLISSPGNNVAWQKRLLVKAHFESHGLQKPQDYESLILKALEFDIAQFQNSDTSVTPIIQDTLFMLKRYAKVIQKNSSLAILEKYRELIALLPEMDSVYLTTTPQERMRRFYDRSRSNIKITGTDKLLLENPDSFFQLDEIYQQQVLQRFPNTRIIDTTNTTPTESAKSIIEEL